MKTGQCLLPSIAFSSAFFGVQHITLSLLIFHDNGIDRAKSSCQRCRSSKSIAEPKQVSLVSSIGPRRRPANAHQTATSAQSCPVAELHRSSTATKKVQTGWEREKGLLAEKSIVNALGRPDDDRSGRFPWSYYM